MPEAPPPTPDIVARTIPAVYSSTIDEAKFTPTTRGKLITHVLGRKLAQIDEHEYQISPTLPQKVGAELVGTFIFIFIGCGSGFIDQRHNITIVGIAFAWGLALLAMIYSVGHISGAHFNPAVTIAFAANGQFPWKQVPLYVAGQLTGAITASLSLRGLFEGDRPTVMLTLPAAETDDLTVVAFEIIMSFILMWVICGAASDHRAIKSLSGVAIGATLFVDVLIAGKVTGASMNPARSIGPAIAAHNFRSIWIYIVAPVIGTVSAAALYNLLGVSEASTVAAKQASTVLSSRLNPIYSGKGMELP